MRLVLAAVLALAAAPILAQQAPSGPPGAPDASRVVAGTYKIDANHSQVLFSYLHMGFTEYTGQFTQPTGSLVLDPKNAANDKVEVTFPIDKISTGVPALDTHLKTPDFFDAAKYPEAKFTSTSVTVHGTTATIVGNLTIKDVTKPITLEARFIGAGNAAMGAKKLNVGFAATATINRSDFHLGFAVPMVADKVDLVINAGFVQE
ncbi:MAG: YceI family protein [Sphingomonas sp.]